MRSRFAPIAASVIAHASALVWMIGHPPPASLRPSPIAAAPHPTPAAPAAPAAPPEPPPMLVELVELDAAPPIPALPAPPARPAASMHVARPQPSGAAPRATSGGTRDAALTTAPARSSGGDAPSTGAPSTGAPGPRSLMTMRSPTLAAGLSSTFLDDFLQHSKPLPPPPPELNTAAHAGDRQIKELKDQLANPMYREIVSDEKLANTQLSLQSLQRERDNLTMRPVGGGRYRNDEESFTIDVAADGTVAIHDKPSIVPEGLGVRFDVTDMIMRARGDDPYAWAKLHFLDKTRDERDALGRRNRTGLLASSPARMRANIDWLWSMTRDPAKRRQGLFELWDDCAETGDAELLAGASAARLIAIGEIHARLRGADMYTADELARLNAHRRSTARFAPYDEARPDPAPPTSKDLSP